jgi:soluble lytic murein transglycosylase-like protein
MTLHFQTGKSYQPAARWLWLLLCLCLCAGAARAERLYLTNGTVLEVDEVWEDASGVWFRRNGLTQLLDRNRVSRIERGNGAAATPAAAARPPETAPAAHIQAKLTAPAETPAPGPRLWIHFVGGARVEADAISETPDGIWQQRGALSVFIARERIERIERETTTTPATNAATYRNLAWTTGQPKLDALIRENGTRFDIDPYLIFCVIHQESQFKLRARSPKGAQGLMQLMPATARRLGVTNAYDPVQNIRGGTRYLKELLDMFAGRVDLALAGYNAGEGAVQKYGNRVPPYRETREYVRRIGQRYEGGPQ